MGNKRSMGSRYEDSYSDRDSKGGGSKSILDKKAIGDITFYKPEEGFGNKIDIIPYEIKSKNHPRVKVGKAKVGDLDYLLDVYVHRAVGPAKQDIICPKKMFGADCPMCRQAGEHWEAKEEKEAKAMWPKRRVFYNVVDAANPDKGIQIFETSHALFEKELIEAASDENEDGTILHFADPDDGCTIRFKAVENTIGQSKYFEFKKWEFQTRKKPISDALIDEAISFDKFITLYSAEEIEKLMYGADDDDDEEEDDKPAKKPERSTKATKREKAVKADDDEGVVDDDDDDEPPAKPRKGKAKPADDDEDEEDETPKCPEKGMKFGKDTDTDDACDDCKLYKKCLAAKKGK